MFSHITLGTNDWSRAKPFWSAIAAALDLSIFGERDTGIAYGMPSGPKIFIGPTYDGKPASHGNGQHVAFLAKSRSIVDDFHAAALANGGTCEGKPGLRPHYHPNYYGAYVRDPDGNKLQAVCYTSKG
ncbi:MAG: lactoylglutathione lyase [Robiginitomaculum sp.]|nr:MAG: lactoylglutathione lyase [Robiginitomaculum sp.]